MADKRSEPGEAIARRSGGARHVSGLLKGIIGPLASKRGFAETEILTRWSAIVGEELGSRSVPERLRYPRGQNLDATLIVRAEGPAALEIQHLAPELIDRINGYYGYRAVTRIQTQQGRVIAEEELTPVREQDLEETVVGSAPDEGLAEIRDEGLRRALGRLGRAIRRGSGRAEPG